MAFALVFIIVLSIILIVGSFLIWKSDLSSNDKILSIIAILALFSLVSIVNEAKKTNYDESKYTSSEFEKNFFTSSETDMQIEFRLPILNDFKYILSESLGGFNFEKPEAFEFALLYGETKIGKSLAAKETTKILQGKRIPTLYVNLKAPNTDIYQFIGLLKLPNPKVLHETIERFNNLEKVPTIFVDNIHNAFVSDVDGFPCSVCDYLLKLYDDLKVNIVMITDDNRAKEYLQSTPAYNRRMNFYPFQDRNRTEVGTYLLEKVNYGIKNPEKKFKSEVVPLFLDTFGLNFQVLSEYTKSTDSFQNVQDFVEKYLENQAQKVTYSHNFNLLSCIGNLMKSRSENSWVEYGSIKKSCDINTSDDLDIAVRSHLLIKEKNSYKFNSHTSYLAANVAVDKKIE